MRVDSATLDLPYDFGSIMQFSHDAYSRNGLPTIMPKINNRIAKEMSEKASWPSKQDYLDLNLYYCGEMIEIKHKMFVYAIRKHFDFILQINAYSIYAIHTECRVFIGFIDRAKKLRHSSSSKIIFATCVWHTIQAFRQQLDTPHSISCLTDKQECQLMLCMGLHLSNLLPRVSMQHGCEKAWRQHTNEYSSKWISNLINRRRYMIEKSMRIPLKKENWVWFYSPATT